MEKYTKQQMESTIISIGNALKQEIAPHQTIEHGLMDELIDKVVDRHLMFIDDDDTDLDSIPVEEELFCCAESDIMDDDN